MNSRPTASPEGRERGFVPGLGRDFLTRLYDPVTVLLGVKSAHRRLVERADVQPGHRVLEIGCGTGDLALQVLRHQPRAEVHGLDPDPVMLERARRKAARAGVRLALTRGFAEELPYPDATFDVVLSAFMFHHLTPEGRTAALAEAVRVLRPGG